MSTYPGAIWRPTGDNGAMPADPDVTSLHIAVSRAEKSVFGWTADAKACHAYNGRMGYFEQYVAWNRKVAGVADGNSHVVTIESFDGLLIQNNPYREIGMGGDYGDNADDGRWDAGQCERVADLLAWQHLSYGLELRVMQTSRRSERGVAPHRLGVAPWRVSDGEVWTRHDGKRCPGDLRVAQIPGIVARAQVIAAAVQAGRCGWLPTGTVDVPAALARTSGGNTILTPAEPATSTPTPTIPPEEDDDMAFTQKQADDLEYIADTLRRTVGYGQKATEDGDSGFANTIEALLSTMQDIKQQNKSVLGALARLEKGK